MSESQQKIIILDRDGVINFDSPEYIKSPEEWLPIPGSIEAIAELSKQGFHVYLATNQSGIGRKLFSMLTFAEINQKLIRQVEELDGEIQGIFFCPHTPDDNCDCRKPKPGLLDEIFAASETSPLACPVVGDSRRDLEAAISAGCRPILVRSGNGSKTLHELAADPLQGFDNNDIFDNLADAAEQLLAEEKRRK
ncbi:MAG: D-glycero-beta-D-manno-heptose 1,7-bisphosphate 7-phosphatase [Gammaproteobacteria bacterium]|jgi:D-glycero-D-manno-heptose 1,7-bisphosphate phosphatase|nr:D-glycero-beta-D-manno-heptose 1,7-bisphosphate 7-phosphatase [Gammaproteobacteria bacterium]